MKSEDKCQFKKLYQYYRDLADKILKKILDDDERNEVERKEINYDFKRTKDRYLDR